MLSVSYRLGPLSAAESNDGDSQVDELVVRRLGSDLTP